jgi:hypothetical protein
MKTSIHISTDMVQVLAYTKVGNRATVKEFRTYPLPEECVLNGVILDETPIVEGLRSLKNSKPLLFNDVSLVIDGSFVYSKQINVPAKLNKWMYDQVIRDEFAEIATDAENLLCCHFPLKNNDDGSKHILACAVESAHVETYLRILKTAGVQPNKVRLETQGILRYIDSKPEYKDLSFILNIVDDDILMSIIFQGGISVFQSRTRLYGDNRETIVQGTLDGLSGIIQFNKSQNFEDIKNCYYMGLSESDMDIIKMNTAYPDINFSCMELFKGVKGGEMLPPNAHIAYLNALVPDSDTDVFYSMKVLEKTRKRNRPKKTYIPVLVGVFSILIAVMALMLFLVRNVEGDIRVLNDFLNSPQVLSEKAEIVGLNNDMYSVSAKYTEAENQINEDNAHPQLTKLLLDTIVQTGGTTVTISGFSFDEATGIVQVSASAADRFAASDYIDRLRRNELIEYVDYESRSSDMAGAYTFPFEVKAHAH